MGALGFSCAWCGRPLVDRQNALEHGPVCPASPVVREVRAAAIFDASDLAEMLAWQAALLCPPEESNAVSRCIAHGAVDALTKLAAVLRRKALAAQEGGR